MRFYNLRDIGIQDQKRFFFFRIDDVILDNFIKILLNKNDYYIYV